jgi:hypothetical protein
MAKFASTSLTLPVNSAGQGRRIVEKVAKRLQSGADAVANQAEAAVVERKARIDSIEDADLRGSIGGLPGFDRSEQ